MSLEQNLQNLKEEIKVFLSDKDFSISKNNVEKSIPFTDKKLKFALKKLAVDPFYPGSLCYFLYLQSTDSRIKLPRLTIPENEQLHFLFSEFIYQENHQIIDDIFVIKSLNKKIISSLKYDHNNSLLQGISKGYIFILESENQAKMKITIHPMSDYLNNGYLQISLENDKYSVSNYYSLLDIESNPQLKENLDSLNIKYKFRMQLDDDEANQEFNFEIAKYVEQLRAMKEEIKIHYPEFRKYDLSWNLNKNLSDKQPNPSFKL